MGSLASLGAQQACSSREAEVRRLAQAAACQSIAEAFVASFVRLEHPAIEGKELQRKSAGFLKPLDGMVREVKSAPIYYNAYAGAQYLGSCGRKWVYSASDNVAMYPETEQGAQVDLKDISCTVTFVKAWNSCRTFADEERRRVLQELLGKILAFIAKQNVNVLALDKGKPFHDFAQLAALEAQGCEKSRQLLSEFLEVMCNQALKEKIMGKNHLLSALESAFHKMDTQVFGEISAHELQDLFNKLLSQLQDSECAFYDQESYREQCSIYYTLRKVLFIMQSLKQSKTITAIPENFLYKNMKRINQIARCASYYPISYHARVLQQSVLCLRCDEDDDIGINIQYFFQCLAYVAKIGLPIWQTVYSLGLDFLNISTRCLDLKSIPFPVRPVRRKKWYAMLMDLESRAQELVTSNEQLKNFAAHAEKIIDSGKQIKNSEDRLALHFGMAQMFGHMSVRGSVLQVRKLGLEQLIRLGECCLEEVEVLIQVFNCLRCVAKINDPVARVRRVTDKALEYLGKLPDRIEFFDRWFEQADKTRRHVKHALNTWKKWNIFQKILTRQLTPQKSCWEGLSTIIKDEIEEVFAHVGTLQKSYQLLDSSHSSLGLELVLLEDARSLTCHAMRDAPYDQNSAMIQAEPIDLKYLFCNLEQAELEREIRSVIVAGKAGTGKTTLTQNLLDEWSKGRWCNDVFDTVYVLCAKDLAKGAYSNFSLRPKVDLTTAIANSRYNCYLPTQYQSICNEIYARLDSPRTLVVLDGLDERNDTNTDICKQALRAGRKHKVLIFFRSIEDMRMGADKVVKIASLNDCQVNTYMQRNLSKDQSMDIVYAMNRNPVLKDFFKKTADVLLNLEVLCQLWRESRGRGVVNLESGWCNMHALYGRFIDLHWDRIRTEYPSDYLGDITQERFFAKLEKLAACHLKYESEKPTTIIMREELAEDRIGIQKLQQLAGFLLSNSQEDQYSFENQTFQQYFAARFLARMLLSGNKDDEKKGTEFFLKQNANPKVRQLISFLAGELVRIGGTNGIKKAFKVVTMICKESTCMQWMIFKLRILQEWSHNAGDDLTSHLAQLEKRYRTMRPLRKCLKRSFREVYKTRNRETLQGFVDLLEDVLTASPTIFMYKPGLLDLVYSLTLKRDARFRETRVIMQTMVKICPYAAGLVLERLINDHKRKNVSDCGIPLTIVDDVLRSFAPGEWVDEEPTEPDNTLVPKEMIRWLGEFVKARPSQAQTILRKFIDPYKKGGEPVRSTIIQLLRRLTEVCPFKSYIVEEALTNF